jgi:hypothetical protein
VRDNREQIQALRIMSDLGVAELGGRSVTQAVEVNPAMVAPLAAT